jgi:hypothetical protein
MSVKDKMIDRRFMGRALAMQAVLVAASAMAFTATAETASAETASPQSFIDGIYRAYVGKNSKGISLSTDASVRRYFAPPLSDAMVKDFAAARRRNEPSSLGGDPFIDGQDWDVKSFKTAVKSTSDNTAVATVTLMSAESRTITLELVRSSAGWRITEIKAPTGSLRAFYKLS